MNGRFREGQRKPRTWGKRAQALASSQKENRREEGKGKIKVGGLAVLHCEAFSWREALWER